MILQVGKKYVTKQGFIYTIISTNRKNEDGYNVVAECERVDSFGNKCPVFTTFKSDGKNADSDFNLIKEYKPRLKVQFTIDLPEHLQGLSMDEIDSAMLDRIRGCSFCDRENLSNIEVICSYEN